MEANELQQQFFDHLKSVLPSHISMVDELTDLLDLSYDSVYRRIRGEKPLALNEIRQICEHYHISLDQVLQLQNDTVVFRAPDINRQSSFPEILKGYLAQLKYMNTFQKRQMFYLCKDLPIWHFYLFPEIGAFKTFFWSKTILNNPVYRHSSFSLSEFSFDDCFAIGQEVIREYNQIPCIELWNLESISSTLAQIKYYLEGGLFKNDSDIAILINSFDRTLEHLQLQAERGVKFMPGATDLTYRSPVQLYINEVVVGNNTILAELDGAKFSFIPYNVFSYMMTKDVRFNEASFLSFETLMSRSSLISVTGEKQRNKFFQILREKVKMLGK